VGHTGQSESRPWLNAALEPLTLRRFWRIDHVDLSDALGFRPHERDSPATLSAVCDSSFGVSSFFPCEFELTCNCLRVRDRYADCASVSLSLRKVN